MDAAKTNFKKTLLLLASALLLAAPAFAVTPTTLVVNPSGGTFNLGSASCNNSQTLTLSSSDGSAISFDATFQYQAGDNHGNWLYLNSAGQQPVTDRNGNPSNVTTSSTMHLSIPAATTQTPNPTVTMQFGLNLTFTSAAQASLLLHPTTGGVANVPLTINFAPSNSCGGTTISISNGFITITPGNLTLTAAQGSSQTNVLTIQNNTNTAITFTTTTPTTDTWLSATGTSSTTINANSQNSVQVTANAQGLNVTTYQSQVVVTPSQGQPLSVPVTFNVTTGTGGTGGSGTLTLNGSTDTLTTVNFNYVNGGSAQTSFPASVCVNLSESNSSITTYGYSISTSTGGPWLLVNDSQFNQTNQALSNTCLKLQPSNVANTLQSGAYFGTVNLTAGDGSTATVNVNLNITNGSAPGVTVSPSQIFNFPNVGVGTNTTASQQFTVTSVSGVILGAPSISSSSVFSLSQQVSGSNQDTFTVTANPSGQPVGTYSALITVGSTGSSSGTTTILVTLQVGQSSGSGCTSNCGGGNAISVAVPASLTFAEQLGSTYWSAGNAAQNISITGAPGTQWSASVAFNTGNGWLNFPAFSASTSAAGTFSNAPANLLVDFNPTGLGVGTYTANILILTPGNNIQIPVTLTVVGNTTPVLAASPASALFFSNNGSVPNALSVKVGGTDQTFPPLGGTLPAITVSTVTPWLGASSNGNVMTLTVNPTGLTTGAYGGSVQVSAAGYGNSPFTYPVVLIVNGGLGGGTTGTLTLSASTLNFAATFGGAVPASQTLTVTAQNSTNASVATSEQNCTSSNWLSISPAGAFTASTVNSNFTVSVNQSGIAAGTTCSGTVTFTTGASTQAVGVTMVVSTTGTGGNITVTPNIPLTFAFTTGGTNPPAQTLHIVNSTSATTTTPFTVSTTSTNNWLVASTAGASTPFDLSLSVDPTRVSASSTPYQGTVTISPTGGTPVTLNVSFTYNAAAVVTATPTTLSFSFTAGGNNPTPGTIQVSGGGAQANFTASASSSGWLKVSPTSGTTPNSGTFPLTVTADPTGLNAGTTYSGTITVTGTAPATGLTIINVSFTVSAPLPTITKVTNAASFVSGAVSPGEFVSLFANASNPIGPATAVKLDSTTCPSPCTTVPTTMGGVQVKFLPRGTLAPLTYVSSTQINLLVPYEVATDPNLQVQVTFLGQSSNAFVLQTTTTAPGIFTQTGIGTGLGAIVQYDDKGVFQGTNSSSNPASAGWTLSIYATGEGQTSPNGITGKVTNAANVFPILNMPNVLIDSLPATVGYSAEAFSFVSGVWQINAVVPQGVHTNTQVPISVTIGGNPSQAGVTVAIK